MTCYALLDQKDTSLLATNPYGVRERPAQQSIRRVLYSCSSKILSDNWTTLNPGVFLFGGFLTDATQIYQQPGDTIVRFASYQSLVMNFICW